MMFYVIIEFFNDVNNCLMIILGYAYAKLAFFNFKLSKTKVHGKLN